MRYNNISINCLCWSDAPMLCSLSFFSNSNLLSRSFFSSSNFSFSNCNFFCSNCNFCAWSSTSFLCFSSKNCNVECFNLPRTAVLLIGLTDEFDNGVVEGNDDDDIDPLIDDGSDPDVERGSGSDESTVFSGKSVEHAKEINSFSIDCGVRSGGNENIGFNNKTLVGHEDVGDVRSNLELLNHVLCLMDKHLSALYLLLVSLISAG